MSEYEKMLAGQVYDATAPEVIKMLDHTRNLCWRYNQLRPDDEDELRALLTEILGKDYEDIRINQPFRCDYGRHIRLGRWFFANFGLTILDEAFVTIGDNVFIGPNVGIYTACHSTDVAERNTRHEWALPVSIGNDCWIGGSVTILPGVTIGDGCTIGAGSVVTRDIPAHSVAVGNPARVVKTLDCAE